MALSDDGVCSRRFTRRHIGEQRFALLGTRLVKAIEQRPAVSLAALSAWAGANTVSGGHVLIPTVRRFPSSQRPERYRYPKN